jgi:hypothetical protein
MIQDEFKFYKPCKLLQLPLLRAMMMIRLKNCMNLAVVL